MGEARKGSRPDLNVGVSGAGAWGRARRRRELPADRALQIAPRLCGTTHVLDWPLFLTLSPWVLYKGPGVFPHLASLCVGAVRSCWGPWTTLPSHLNLIHRGKRGASSGWLLGLHGALPINSAQAGTTP